PVAASPTESKELLRTLLRHKEPVLSVVYSPDGKVLASSAGHGALMLWDTGTGELLRPLPHDSAVLVVAFSPDHQRLAVALQEQDRGRTSRVIQLWNSATGKLEQSFTREDMAAISHLAFSPDGKSITAAATTLQPTTGRRQRNSEITVWDVVTGQARS